MPPRATRTPPTLDHRAASLLHLRGRARHLEAPGRFEALIAGDGRFWWAIDGPLPEQALGDAHRVVVTDYNGNAAVVHGREAASPRLVAALLGAPWPGVVETPAAWPLGALAVAGTAWPARFETAGDGGRVAELTTPQGVDRHSGMAWPEWAAAGVSRRVERWIGGAVRTVIEIDSAEWVTHRTMPVLVTGSPVSVGFTAAGLEPVETRRAPTGQTLIRAAADGVEGWWVLDTGGSTTAIDPHLAARLGLQAIGSTLLVSMYDRSQAPIHRVGHLAVGPVRLAGVAVVEMDLTPLSRAATEPLLGILGIDVFSRAVVEFGRGDDPVRIGSPDSPLPACSWVPFELRDRHPVVAVSLGDGYHGRARLDTGAGPGLILNQWVAEDTTLLREQATEPIAGAPFEGRVATVEGVVVAGRAVGATTAIFVTGGDGPLVSAFQDRDLLGNVGFGILRDFTVLLDGPRDRLALMGGEGSAHPDLEGSTQPRRDAAHREVVGRTTDSPARP